MCPEPHIVPVVFWEVLALRPPGGGGQAFPTLRHAGR